MRHWYKCSCAFCNYKTHTVNNVEAFIGRYLRSIAKMNSQIKLSNFVPIEHVYNIYNIT